MNRRFKEVRKALGLTQNGMAACIGLAQSEYCRLETKGVSIRTVYINLLESKFNVNRSWLMTGEGDMFIDNGELNEIIAIYKEIPQPFRWLLINEARNLKEVAVKLE